MAKERSPNSPKIDLAEAADLVKKFYASEGRTAVDTETAVKALGYTGLSGASRTKLGSLKQYGLLQGREDAVSVSALGLRIVHPDDDADYLAALQEAARNPGIFATLLDSHLGASETAIVAYLIKNKKFTQEGAREVAKAFKATVAVAKLTLGMHTTNGRLAENDGSKDSAMEQTRDTKAPSGQKWRPGFATEGAGLPDDASWFSVEVPYRSTTMLIRVAVIGERLTQKHLRKAIKHLELAAEDMDDESI